MIFGAILGRNHVKFILNDCTICSFERVQNEFTNNIEVGFDQGWKIMSTAFTLQGLFYIKAREDFLSAHN